MKKEERFFWIDVGYACFGIVSVGGSVTEAAPIAFWMVGKRLQDIRGWLIKKRAVVREIPQ